MAKRMKTLEMVKTLSKRHMQAHQKIHGTKLEILACIPKAHLEDHLNIRSGRGGRRLSGTGRLWGLPSHLAGMYHISPAPNHMRNGKGQDWAH